MGLTPEEELELLELEEAEYQASKKSKQLAEKKTSEDDSLITKKGLTKSVLESLPVAGAVLGGGAGFLTPVPGGAYAGAGLGAAAGKALENLGEKLLLDEEKTRKEIYLDPAVEGASAIAGEGLGNIAGKVVQKTAQAVPNVLKKAASNISKVPEKAIETFATRADEVAKIGGGEDSLALAANEMRESAQKTIESFKVMQNSKIDAALEKSKNKLVDMSPALKVLEQNLRKIDPDVNPQAAQKIAEEIRLINSKIETGTSFVSAPLALQIQKRMQNLAEYLPDGQILKKKDFGERTLTLAASKVRTELGKVAPEIKSANSELAKLRRLDKTLNKNLITPDKPLASITAAGSGLNPIQSMQLKRLDDVLGSNLVGKAENIAAAKYFNEAGPIPQQITGSSTIPILGGIVGSIGVGAENPYATALGLGTAALGSPLAIKTAIQASKATRPAIRAVTPIIDQAVKRSSQLAISQAVNPLYTETPSERARRMDLERKQMKGGQ